MRIKLFVAAAGLLAISGAAQAAAVFFDNFDAYAGAGIAPAPNSFLNWGGGNGWTITSGTVDLVANSDFGITCFGGGGKCIDLDGSTHQSGLLFNGAPLTMGTTYTLTFEMSGNQRMTQTDTVTVNFGGGGGTTSVIAVPGAAGNSTFSLYSLSFTPTTTTASAQFSFQDSSTNNVGAIIDDVTVTAVPLPASGWLLLSAVGALGVFGRKRAARDAPA